jgi:four helix bundle protein
MTLELKDLEVYQMASEIADDVWQRVDGWEKFAKDTVGKQLVRSADSIAANISEGYGRYAFKENIQFRYYARGSMMETGNWFERAHQRHLFGDEAQYQRLNERLELPARKLNAYIKSIKEQMKQYPGLHSKQTIKTNE